MTQPKRDPWLQAQYERIGREREAAGREADRLYRWELVRVLLEIVGWTALGCVVAAWGFRVTRPALGWVFIHLGQLIVLAGVVTAIATAYLRGDERGDW